MTMPQIRTWKKTVNGLVSTVPEYPVPVGSESCHTLARRNGGAGGGESAEIATGAERREGGVYRASRGRR